MKDSLKKMFISFAGVVFITGLVQLFTEELTLNHIIFFITLVFIVLFSVCYKIFIRQEIIFAKLEGDSIGKK